jgi:hypothetical protein
MAERSSATLDRRLNFTNGTWIIVFKNVGISAAERMEVTL